jgi:hypothetical protein
MQCFLCDSEMSVVMVEPCRSLDMHIFDYRTFRCGSCGDTEKRLGLPSKPSEPMIPLPSQPFEIEQLASDNPEGEEMAPGNP